MGKTLGLVGAALLPPGLAFTFLQNWAKTHPMQAVAALIAYEAVVGFVAFFWKIAGGAADELGQRWKVSLADSTDKALRRRFSRFDKQYRDAVLGSLRFIDLKGLATVGFYTPQLDEVFVDVSLVYSAPTQVPEGVLGQKSPDRQNRHFIGDLLGQPHPAVLAVVGAPGSGKTTLLRHTARAICRSRRGRRTVPVLLYLRDHVAAIAANPEVSLAELVASSLGKHGPVAPAGWFERKLRDGRCAVLLDGLDEVADQSSRRGVADWVERQLKRYPANDYVITSRPHGYRTARVDGATVVQVRSFTDEQVTRFVHGWYLAIEQRSTGVSDADVKIRAANEADDLLERLNHSPALYELTVNPLLLTMIATVHKFRGALPGGRVDLYREICEVLLWRRQEAKNLESPLTSDQKTALLSGLAFTMMRRHLRDLPRDEVITEIRPMLRRMAKAVDEQDFLADMGSNGLLIERESGLYSFAHLTFQEYLAAAHIREKRLADVLIGAVDDVWWREVTLLYVARGDADAIVQACLETNAVNSLSLAFECAELSSEVDPELWRELDARLAVGPRVDPALVIGVMLSRHLSKLVRTGEGTRICAHPIKTNPYGHFTLQTGGPVPDAPALGSAPHHEPVGGVRADDARRFVKWVNELTDNQPGFRLPSRAEVESSPLRRTITDHSIWLKDGDLWIPPGPHPHAVNTATLSNRLYHDLLHDPDLLFSAKGLPGADAAQPEQLTVAPGSPFQLDDLEGIVGRAAARAMIRTTKITAAPKGNFLGFERLLVNEVISHRNTYIAPPGRLVALLREASNTELTRWGDRQLDGLVAAGTLVFERQIPLTQELAAHLRLMAMRLAVEADSVVPDTGEVFRHIAAGVTLLQLRAEGKAPAPETIVLATD
ncbi:NACHT domain-containing protein [Lentzea tibetensis]|uniref:NACHT domain-containing protein n=1 Tax=Lentzea tibetensis TaxID=2591470 RepID=A0A563F1L4_9PSEU|nr:NACHT domain-containing protein [Lentzea tibetensis]TWP53254.1 NACHT domain-containing protein [Lentzea tibetensis]